jgi:hypothetical protein
LLIALVVLLAATAMFVLRPLLRAESPQPGTASDPRTLDRRELDPAARARAAEELLWRARHDLETGRIDQEEFAAQERRAEALRAGRAQGARVGRLSEPAVARTEEAR